LQEAVVAKLIGDIHGKRILGISNPSTRKLGADFRGYISG
jgi:hypothetical protein